MAHDFLNLNIALACEILGHLPLSLFSLQIDGQTALRPLSNEKNDENGDPYQYLSSSFIACLPLLIVLEGIEMYSESLRITRSQLLPFVAVRVLQVLVEKHPDLTNYTANN